jgi:hypothetical protein
VYPQKQDSIWFGQPTGKGKEDRKGKKEKSLRKESNFACYGEKVLGDQWFEFFYGLDGLIKRLGAFIFACILVLFHCYPFLVATISREV